MSHATWHGRHRPVVTFDTAARREVSQPPRACVSGPLPWKTHRRASRPPARGSSIAELALTCEKRSAASCLPCAYAIHHSLVCRRNALSRATDWPPDSRGHLLLRNAEKTRGVGCGAGVCVRSLRTLARSLRRRSSRNWRDHLSSAANSRLVDHHGEEDRGPPPIVPRHVLSRYPRPGGRGTAGPRRWSPRFYHPWPLVRIMITTPATCTRPCSFPRIGLMRLNRERAYDVFPEARTINLGR